MGKHIADQPPDLAAEDGSLIEAKQTEESAAAIKQAEDQHNGIADGNIEHEIGNALISVNITKSLEISA